MKTKQKPRVRVNKSKKLARRRFPRWAMFVVIGLVAVVGIALIVTTFAAGVLPTSVKKVIPGGAVSQVDSTTALARSPITVDACRMSDNPGEGPGNRVYVGAKPVISVELANKMNAVWNQYYPQYKVTGQNVPYALDYSGANNVNYSANYIVDRRDPTNTTKQYSDYYNPTEAKSLPDKNRFFAREPIDWKYANFMDSAISSIHEKPYDIAAQSNYINSKLDANTRGLTAANSTRQPDINYIAPFKLPGKTYWSYIDGPVMVYNDGKCPKAGFGCQNDRSKYDVVNNPNPFIKFDVSWLSARLAGVVNKESSPVKEHVVKVVRFKDLPRCGVAPVKQNAEWYAEADRFDKLFKEQNAKFQAAYNARSRNGNVSLDQQISLENDFGIYNASVFTGGISGTYSGNPGPGYSAYYPSEITPY